MGSSASVLRTSYIDRVLVRRVNLGLLGCPSHHTIVYLDHGRLNLNLGLAWLANGNSTPCCLMRRIFRTSSNKL